VCDGNNPDGFLQLRSGLPVDDDRLYEYFSLSSAKTLPAGWPTALPLLMSSILRANSAYQAASAAADAL